MVAVMVLVPFATAEILPSACTTATSSFEDVHMIFCESASAGSISACSVCVSPFFISKFFCILIFCTGFGFSTVTVMVFCAYSFVPNPYMVTVTSAFPFLSLLLKQPLLSTSTILSSLEVHSILL